MEAGERIQLAPIRVTGWLPGYPDPEYFLRLLFQSTSRTNEGGFADSVFDELIEGRARSGATAAGSSASTKPTATPSPSASP